MRALPECLARERRPRIHEQFFRSVVHLPVDRRSVDSRCPYQKELYATDQEVKGKPYMCRNRSQFKKAAFPVFLYQRSF